MRRDAEYLRDILEASDAVKRFLAGVDRTEFERDELRQGAVVHRLTVIGEAAAKLPDALRARAPGVDWRRVVAFRNLVVHAYFAIDWRVVWMVAIRDLPVLRRETEALLRGLEDGR